MVWLKNKILVNSPQICIRRQQKNPTSRSMIVTCVQCMFIIIIIIHEFNGDTSLKQNFRAEVSVTY